MVTFEQVSRFLETLGPVTRGVWWRNPTWCRGSRVVAWQRPLSKADHARLVEANAPVPHGELLAVMVESLDEKDAVLSLGLPGVFTLAHFDGTAAVLVELRLARVRDVRALLRRAWTSAAAPKPSAPRRTAARRRR